MVCPTLTLGDDGVIETAAAVVAVDVNCVPPVTPSAVAEIVVVPELTAVTRPPFDTEATAGFALAHLRERPTSAAPVLSYAVVVN